MEWAVTSPVSLKLVYKYLLRATKCFDYQKKKKAGKNTASLGKPGISSAFSSHVLLGGLAEDSNYIILLPAPDSWASYSKF